MTTVGRQVGFCHFLNLFQPTILFVIHMNAQSFMVSILGLLAECIVQSRVDVKKQQISKFNEFVQQISRSRHKISDHSFIVEMLGEVILEQTVRIEQQLRVGLCHPHLIIIFTLRNLSNMEEFYAEIWSIHIERKLADVSPNSFTIIATIFQEILLFLNQQPLFSEYQKDSKLRSEYQIDYEVCIGNQHNADQIKQLSQSQNLLKLSHKHVKKRVTDTYVFWIESHSLPSLSCLHGMPGIRKCRSQSECEDKSLLALKQEESENEDNSLLVLKQEEFIDGSTEMLVEDIEDFTASCKSGRKLSIYEYYDEKLDFTFLSNDCQSFSSSPKELVRELEIQEAMGCTDDDEEFETLQVSRDEQLVNDSIALLRQLSQGETSGAVE